MENKEILSALIQALWTVFAAWAAVKLGLSSWKNQQLAGRRHEAALAFSLALLEYKSAIDECRNGRYPYVKAEEETYSERFAQLYEKKRVMIEKEAPISLLLDSKGKQSMTSHFREIGRLEWEMTRNVEIYLQRKRKDHVSYDESDGAVNKIIFRSDDWTDEFENRFSTEVDAIQKLMEPFIILK